MSVSPPAARDDRRPSGAPAGIVLVTASLVAIAAIAHHPTAGRKPTPEELLAQIVRLQHGDHAVHAFALAATAALLYGLAVFAIRNDPRRSVVVGGLVAYALGSVLVAFAALTDGFVVPSIAAAYAGHGPAAVTGAVQLLNFCAIVIQVCTKFWLFATSLAVVLWSAAIVRGGAAQLALAGLGFVAGALVVVLTATSSAVTPHSLGIVVVLEALWYVGIGVEMIRGRV